jgi:predicted ATP-dependent protease
MDASSPLAPPLTVFRRIPPAELRRARELTGLAFETTAELEDLPAVLGQARAVEAIAFGIGMAHPGYNLYAMGPEGVGRRTVIHRLLRERAVTRPAPPDWCYVFDFEAPTRPRHLMLPAGRAPEFKSDVDRLVGELRLGIPAAFETDEYRSRRQELEQEFGERQEQGIGEVGERARKQGIALLRTPGGFGFAPMEGDGVMAPDRFRALPEEERRRFETAIEALQKDLEAVIEQVPRWRREAQHRLRELNRQVTHGVVNTLIRDVQEKYRELPAAFEHLAALREDVLDHAELFQQPKEGEVPAFLMLAKGEGGESRLLRYLVNVLVHNDPTAGAPIVYEDHPTHDNLVGRIEHESRLGALETDFTLVRGGALHRANGGYLLVDAVKVLTEPLAWEALKRALRSGEIRSETLARAIGLVSTTSLEPAPIPLEVKVVLIGSRMLYYLLHAYDPEFGDLFKVMADFEEDMARTPESDALYARLIATVARGRGLRPLTRDAVGRVVEAAARRAADTLRVSIEMAPLTDLLVEADHFAAASGAAATTAADVQRAIEAQERRADRVRGRVREEMLRGTLLVATEGERAGQVNGLSVAQLGGFAFGMPARITASVRYGHGMVIDIERESDLGGPIHSKGVLILSGYLAGRYVPGRPLSLTASLVFEQSYAGVEGDSASSAELYALLSALADVPVRQSLAVTGSVNQHGDVQAVGGVNEKVEGFFDLCRARGLTGRQGVLVPAANVPHLVLREDVMTALAAGTFHLYAIETIDQGLEVLTGMPAGERDALGRFPAGSLNARIEARLAALAERGEAMPPQRRSKGRPVRRGRPG